MNYPKAYETLPAQLKAILMRYTKTTRIDEIIDELMQAVLRDSPKVEVPVFATPCNHMSRVVKNQETGKKELKCKHCHLVQPIVL